MSPTWKEADEMAAQEKRPSYPATIPEASRAPGEPGLELHYCDMCGATKMLARRVGVREVCGLPTGKVSMSGVIGLPIHCGGWMVPTGEVGKRGKMQGVEVPASAPGEQTDGTSERQLDKVAPRDTQFSGLREIQRLRAALSEAHAERDDILRTSKEQGDLIDKMATMFASALSTKDAEIARLTEAMERIKATSSLKGWRQAVGIAREALTPTPETNSNG
jgi:hypothetical protein